MQPEERELLQSTHDTVTQLKTVLVGMNGDEGVIGELKHIKLHQQDTNNRLRKLSLKFWMLVAGLIGSGLLGGYGLLS